MKTLICLLLASQLFATNYVSVATGDFLTSSTWSPTGVPVAGDTWNIANGHVVTATSTTYSTGTLTVATSGTSIVGAGTTWASSMVGGTITIQGEDYELTSFTDTINYIALAAHTSGSSTKPAASQALAGLNWRTTWEPQSLYLAQRASYLGTTIADGSIGCSTCSYPEAATKWVIRGSQPMNPAVWNVGKNNKTPGAVQPVLMMGPGLMRVVAR